MGYSNIPDENSAQVAPSDVAVGNEIQDPKTRAWFVVSGIRISLAAPQQRIFRRVPTSECDCYYFSGAGGELITCFEGQQLVHRHTPAVAPDDLIA
jgi:hypothetical protein